MSSPKGHTPQDVPLVTQTTGLPVAEPGTSTSEFKALVATAVADALQTAIVFGVHLTPAQVQIIELDMGVISTVASLYILGRSLRKKGTAG